MSQDIYGITIDKLLEAIDRASKLHYGYAFGNSSPEKMKEFFNGMAADGETLNLSKVCNALRGMETAKMPGNANKAINLIIRLINENKVPIPENVTI